MEQPPTFLKRDTISKDGPMPYGVPSISGCIGPLEFAWRLLPACGHSTSGDAVLQETARTDGRVQFLLLDVSGKGPSAAAVVATVKWQLQVDDQLSSQSPAELLSILHSRLAPVWAETGHFVCAMAVLVDGGGCSIEAANAGQPLPVTERNGSVSPWVLPSGFPLGVPVENARYESAHAALQPGETVLFVSDGATDVRSPGSRPIGAAGLIDHWKASTSWSASLPHRIDALLDALEQIAHDDWPQDDTTVLCVQFGGGRPG